MFLFSVGFREYLISSCLPPREGDTPFYTPPHVVLHPGFSQITPPLPPNPRSAIEYTYTCTCTSILLYMHITYVYIYICIHICIPHIYIHSHYAHERTYTHTHTPHTLYMHIQIQDEIHCPVNTFWVQFIISTQHQ